MFFELRSLDFQALKEHESSAETSMIALFIQSLTFELLRHFPAAPVGGLDGAFVLRDFIASLYFPNCDHKGQETSDFSVPITQRKEGSS